MLLLCGFQGLLQWPFSKSMDIPPATFRPTSGGTWDVPLGRKLAVLEHTGFHLRENGAAMRRVASLRDFETTPLSGSYCVTKKRILVRPGAGAPSSPRYTLHYSRVSRGTLHLTGAFLLLLMGGVHYAGRDPVAEAAPGGSFIVQVQLLRGLACLLVIIDHFFYSASWINLGAVGVGIFFLVSGFVIPISLRSAGSPLTFLKRRCFRLYPVAIFSTLGVVLFSYFVRDIYVRYDGVPLPPMTFWHFMSTCLQVWDLVDAPLFRPIFWTLVIEEKFYWLMALSFAANGKSARHQLCLWMIGILSVVLAVSFFLPEYFQSVLLRNVMFMAYMCLGMILFLRYEKALPHEHSVRYAAGCLALIAGALFWAPHWKLGDWSMPMIERTISYPKWEILKSYATAAAVFMALHHRRSWLLLLKPVNYFGLGFIATISYPLYVIHPEVNSALLDLSPGNYDPLVWCALLMGFCYLVHRFIEKPFIQIGKKTDRKVKSERQPGA